MSLELLLEDYLIKLHTHNFTDADQLVEKIKNIVFAKLDTPQSGSICELIQLSVVQHCFQYRELCAEVRVKNNNLYHSRIHTHGRRHSQIPTILAYHDIGFDSFKMLSRI